MIIFMNKEQKLWKKKQEGNKNNLTLTEPSEIQNFLLKLMKLLDGINSKLNLV